MTQSWLEVKLTTIEAKAVLTKEGLYDTLSKNKVGLAKSKGATLTETLFNLKEDMSDAIIKLYSKHNYNAVLDFKQKKAIPLLITGIYNAREVERLKREILMRNRSGIQSFADHDPFMPTPPPMNELIRRAEWVKVKTQGYAYTPTIPLHSRNV